MKKFNKFLSVAVASAMVMAMAVVIQTMVLQQPVQTQQRRMQQLPTVQHPAAYLRSVVSDLLPVAQQFMDWLYSTVQRLQ
jgi:hypothetical protein